MYGIFMVPLLAATSGGAGLKFLEIGLGCDYVKHGKNPHHTHAGSARLWRKLAPKAELWEAEFDRIYVEASRELWRELNINVLVGDQGNSSVLDSWLRQSGGAFDIVIDDGSHQNAHMLSSFHKLWPEVKPGGFYFIEDLHVGRHAAWDLTHGEAVIADVLHAWNEQLMSSSNYGARSGCFSRLRRGPPGAPDCPDWEAASHVHARQMRAKFPLPKQVAFIFCQDYACAVGKKS